MLHNTKLLQKKEEKKEQRQVGQIENKIVDLCAMCSAVSDSFWPHGLSEGNCKSLVVTCSSDQRATNLVPTTPLGFNNVLEWLTDLRKILMLPECLLHNKGLDNWTAMGGNRCRVSSGFQVLELLSHEIGVPYTPCLWCVHQPRNSPKPVVQGFYKVFF